MIPILSFLIPIVGAICLFTFLAVSSWAEERRKEREAFYRSEVLKKLLDSPGTNTQQVLDMIREEEQSALRRRQEGLKLGGLITTAVGFGIVVFLAGAVHTDEPVWMVGLIPLLVGVVLLVYAFFLAPKAG